MDDTGFRTNITSVISIKTNYNGSVPVLVAETLDSPTFKKSGRVLTSLPGTFAPSDTCKQCDNLRQQHRLKAS